MKNVQQCTVHTLQSGRLGITFKAVAQHGHRKKEIAFFNLLDFNDRCGVVVLGDWILIRDQVVWVGSQPLAYRTSKAFSTRL